MAVTGFRLGLAAALMAEAAAANAACLTEPQFQAMARFLAPDLIKAGAGKCAALLPPTSYLRRSGDALADRYRPGAATAWPEIQVFLKSQPELKLFSTMDETTMRGMFLPMLSDGMSKEKFKAEDCAMADAIAADLDPLPPQSVIGLITTLMRLDKGKPAKASGERGRSPIICPRAAR